MDNTSNKLKRLIALSTGVVMVLAAGAKTPPSGNGNPNPGTVIISIPLKPKPNPHRPRIPSAQEMICTYTDSYIYIEAAIPEGDFSMTLLDAQTGETVTAIIDSEAPEAIYVGYHESAEVTVTTEYGHTYTGSW